MRACPHCEEPILKTDRFELINLVDEHGRPARARIHWECRGRMVLGSVGHLLQMCSCFTDTDPFDDPPMSRRGAARMAVEVAQRLGRGETRKEIIEALETELLHVMN